MITSIRIQNYKSLKDTVIHLDKVNLLIGANNSGKSNFLKALVDIQELIEQIIDTNSYNELQSLKNDIFRRNNISEQEIFFEIGFKVNQNDYFLSLIVSFGLGQGKILGALSKNKSYLSEIPKIISEPFTEQYLFDNDIYIFENKIYHSVRNLHINNSEEFSDFQLYNINIFKNNFSQKRFWLFIPEISSFLGLSDPIPTYQLSQNADNLISFLYNLSQENKKSYQQLIANLHLCVPEIVDIGLPIEAVGKIRLRFFDKSGNRFLADEVSEGILYFLAFLALIHQPNPPKVILLDEPETGIHPRRISELINYLFQLASEKDIQVIMASHSPLVLNEFKDIPEAVHVFDKEDGKTIIRNLEKDIINPQNEAFKKAGLKEIDFTDELSENWLMGLLNGVPND